MPRRVRRRSCILVVLVLALVGLLLLVMLAFLGPGFTLFRVFGHALDGTSWTLIEMDGHPPVAGSTVTIQFRDGRVSGRSGCNDYNGDYAANTRRVQMGLIFRNLMNCLGPRLMEQENRFSAILSAIHRSPAFYRRVGARLEILDDLGNPVLIFEEQK
jgi:hypothetical protein